MSFFKNTVLNFVPCILVSPEVECEGSYNTCFIYTICNST